jgi:hypothetical protein
MADFYYFIPSWLPNMGSRSHWFDRMIIPASKCTNDYLESFAAYPQV